jgi:glutamate dehydrogenase
MGWVVMQNMRAVDQLIERVLDYASIHYDTPKRRVFENFVRLYFSEAPISDLSTRQSDELLGLVRCHWELLTQGISEKNGFLFNLFNPDIENYGWSSTHTIMQLVVSNMPFVVDSVRIAIDRLGMSNHLMIYTGGIVVERNSSGEVLALHSRNDSVEENDQSVYSIEAPIHIEIGCHTDQKTLQKLRDVIVRVIAEVRLVTKDWKLMTDMVEQTIHSLQDHPDSVDIEEIKESTAYLQWLLDKNFIFFGMRDYAVKEKEGEKYLELISGSGLGVLRDEEHSKKTKYFSEFPVELQNLLVSTQNLLVISKTNTVSSVHRSGYTDYCGVKRFDESGRLLGERRFIGLFASSAYEAAPETIPFLRRKVKSVLSLSRFYEHSHSGKELRHILSTLPRDDLFQASISELLELSLGIVHLQERKNIRLFLRKDIYNRFMSCLVYVPRERFSSSLLKRMQDVLMHVFEGVEVSFTTNFTASVLAQIHFVIRIKQQVDLDYDVALIEQQLVSAGLSWKDRLYQKIFHFHNEEKAQCLFDRYADSFHPGYQQRFLPIHAVDDIAYMESLNECRQLEMNAYSVSGSELVCMGFKLYRKDKTVPLYEALPMLENLGLKVISEEAYELCLSNGEIVWINDLHLEFKNFAHGNFNEVRTIFQDAFYSVWLNNSENDEFNALVLAANLTWREVVLLRSYARYFKQIETAFSQQYIADTLLRNAPIVSKLLDLFMLRFNPDVDDIQTANDKMSELSSGIITDLDEVKVLDEDRILRKYLHLINATIRTNYFQESSDGGHKQYVSFKIDPSKIPGFPLPVPCSEIFVYSPRFEGVHIRFDHVARGGLRWSNRREDYRTEVLGLSKAQQVKNSIIVPAGAKGGFITKHISISTDREVMMKEGVACYQLFINGLLDLVDNYENNRIVRCGRIRAYDEDDPYLVVAADKGTATFSDYANSVSQQRGFWLSDAFASGGKTGYDHKKIGITARGAWVSAERHFQELGMNVNEAKITVLGIGDMAGDVFGNGLLISNKVKLVAAFNHMHIFLDPNPDPAVSFAERLRLFNLPRSTWADYNQSLLSNGGGVFNRSDKQIYISPEIGKLLGISVPQLVPSDLIKYILRAPVDMIWNGGIGTFVKSSEEDNSQACDRTNNAIRVDANQLNARVICEGGNLGVTQMARMQFASLGGSVNTDFIDNSAGVDCSDHEVNIKIMLNQVVSDGLLTEKQRNQLMKKMTDDVAELVLADNYAQNRAICQCFYVAPNYMSLFSNFIKHHEMQHDFNRDLEFLPSDVELDDRCKRGVGLTKPEISVLMSHSKIILEKRIIQLDFLDDVFFQKFALDYFPKILQRRYPSYVFKHRLYKRIISTCLSNMLVSDMGFAYVFQLEKELNVSIDCILKSYLVAREIFSMDEISSSIIQHDYQVDAKIQHKMSEVLVKLIRRATRWIIYNVDFSTNTLDHLVSSFKKGMPYLIKKIPRYFIGKDLDKYNSSSRLYLDAGVQETLSKRVALLPNLYHCLLIIDASERAQLDLTQLSKVYFKIVQQLDLIWLREQINSYAVTNHWVALAKTNAKLELDRVQSKLAIAIINFSCDAKTPQVKMRQWVLNHEDFISHWHDIVHDFKNASTLDFAMISVAINQLVRFADQFDS